MMEYSTILSISYDTLYGITLTMAFISTHIEYLAKSTIKRITCKFKRMIRGKPKPSKPIDIIFQCYIPIDNRNLITNLLQTIELENIYRQKYT